MAVSSRLTGLHIALNVDSCSVDSVRVHPSHLRVQLLVWSIGMHGIGQSCSLHYEHAGSNLLDAQDMLELHTRDTDTITFGYSPNVPSRPSIFPPGNPTIAEDVIE